MNKSDYQWETASIDGFLAQLVRYVTAGYYFYVRCLIPEGKDPHAVDRKLMQRYGIGGKKWRRERRNLKDAAGVHYLRYGRILLILATKGRHDALYEDHGSSISDIRAKALKVFGYSIRLNTNTGKVRIRLDMNTYRDVKWHMLTVCTWDSYRDPKRLEREFERLQYQPYSPVFEQLLSIAKQVQKARRRRGFERIDFACIPRLRRLRRVFVEEVRTDTEYQHDDHREQQRA